jgi:hypothetical protein
MVISVPATNLSLGNRDVCTKSWTAVLSNVAKCKFASMLLHRSRGSTGEGAGWAKGVVVLCIAACPDLPN